MRSGRRGRRLALLAGAGAAALVAVLVVFYRDRIHVWYLTARDFERLGRNAQGYVEYRHRRTGIVFVSLPGGTFEMGMSEEERETFEPRVTAYGVPLARRGAKLPHEVVLSPFLVAKYEVTRGQWREVMGPDAASAQGGDELPVTEVTWDECARFCELTGLSLPSEAQWEYACRGGSTEPFGNPDELDEVAWHSGNTSGLQPGGRKRPNGFGIHDMHGNVWEWCLDRVDWGFYGKPEARGPDPVAVDGLPDRIRRGGGFSFGDWAVYPGNRYRCGPSERAEDHGFRPVFNLGKTVPSGSLP